LNNSYRPEAVIRRWEIQWYYRFYRVVIP